MKVSHLDFHGKILTFVYFNLFLLSYLNYLQASLRNPGFVKKINVKHFLIKIIIKFSIVKGRKPRKIIAGKNI